MACLACEGTTEKELYQGIKTCPSCNFAWADLNLSADDWKKIYSCDYFFGEEYADYIKEEQPLRKNFRRNLKWIRKFISCGKLLEVGSAYGFFLDEAKKDFLVSGVDIHDEGCRYTTQHFKVPAASGDFLNMKLEENAFDAIAMWDVLEHLPRPDLFLQKSARLLKPGGHLFFSTLDITSLPARLRGRRWRQIHPPTHVSYFSRQSLKEFLKKANLNIIDEKYYGDFRSWENTAYNLLVLRAKNQKLYDILNKRGWLKGDYYLNTFDHIYGACVKI